MRRLLVLTALAAGCGAAVWAAPEPGAAVPSTFRSHVVADGRTDRANARNRTDKMHCLVTENALNPVVAVFSRTAPAAGDAPLAKVAKSLDALVAKYKADRLGTFVAFLTLVKEYPEDEQRDEKKKAVKDLAEQLKTGGVPFTLAAGTSAATQAFALKEADDLTVVFYHRMAVVKAWTFAADKPIADADIKQIEDALAAELKKK